MRTDTSLRPRARPRFGQAAGVGLLCALVSLASACGCAGATERGLSVVMDKAKVFKYPAGTETIVVGNPVIADVTMLKNSGLLILTGRGFGETNLVFLDHAGAVLSEADLRVEPSPAFVVVQRGAERESYACHPRCEPAVSLGDSTTYMTETIRNITSRNAAAAAGAGAGAGH